MTDASLLLPLLAFSLLPSLCLLLCLYLYGRGREAALLATVLSLVQANKAGLTLTPSLLRTILDHHKLPAADRSLIQRLYGLDDAP